MYECGTEFKIILTDYHCPHKLDGRCHHSINIDPETGQSIHWCDEKLCPIALKNFLKKCPICDTNVPATFECGDCGWKDDGTKYTNIRCSCGNLLIQWDETTYCGDCQKEHKSYYCNRCDTEQLHHDDGSVDVVS